MTKFLFTAILFLSSGFIFADAKSEGQQTQTTLAAQTMITELGLRESTTASRDLAGWSRPAKIVMWTDKPERLAGLQAVAPGVEIVLVENLEQAVAESQDAQAVLGFCRQEIFENAPQLHWVQVYWAGVERCVVLPAMQTGKQAADQWSENRFARTG